MKNYILIKETWTESEAGWGCRPDGFSLHISKEDCTKYVKAYWDRMPPRVNGAAPHEYTHEDGNLQVVQVSKKLYDQVKKSKSFGVRYWNSDYSKLVETKQIKELV
jgi:hypothetical protein